MGLQYNTYLPFEEGTKVFACRKCKTHLSRSDEIISKNFRGQHGKAYLFNTVVNVNCGDPGERSMTTGRHVVRDILCRECCDIVGWKYDKAYEALERYKEGKYILEIELLYTVSNPDFTRRDLDVIPTELPAFADSREPVPHHALDADGESLDSDEDADDDEDEDEEDDDDDGSRTTTSHDDESI